MTPLKALAIAGLAALTLTTTATATPNTDPRKCVTTNRTPAHFCAQNAASLAFSRHLAHINHSPMIWVGQLSCNPTGPKLTTWKCNFRVGVGTVTFKALPNGWHTTVAIKCNNPALRPVGYCLSHTTEDSE